MSQENREGANCEGYSPNGQLRQQVVLYFHFLDLAVSHIFVLGFLEFLLQREIALWLPAARRRFHDRLSERDFDLAHCKR